MLVGGVCLSKKRRNRPTRYAYHHCRQTGSDLVQVGTYITPGFSAAGRRRSSTRTSDPGERSSPEGVCATFVSCTDGRTDARTAEMDVKNRHMELCCNVRSHRANIQYRNGGKTRRARLNPTGGTHVLTDRRYTCPTITRSKRTRNTNVKII